MGQLRHCLHTFFGLSNAVGWVSVVGGQAEPSDAILPGPVPGLWVLPCGPRPSNPAELLTSPDFSDLLDALRDRHDFVLLDTPAVLDVTGPCAVVPRADGVGMFGDAVWEDGWPNGGTTGTAGDAPGSPSDLFKGTGNGAGMMGRCSIARHGMNPLRAPTAASISSPYPGGINIGAADGHVEFAKLDTLWSKWYWHALSVPQKRPGL